MIKTVPPGVTLKLRWPAARRVIAPALGVALLALALSVGIASGSGTVPAATGCAYGQCTSTMPFALSTVAIFLIILAVIAVAIAVLWLRGRSRKGPSTAPVTPWTAATPPDDGLEAADLAAPAAAVGAGAAAAAASDAYVEGPEDQGIPPPEMPAAAPAAVAASGEEPDIDSLMQELDKISGEILQRNQPKKGAEGAPSGAAGSAAEDEGASE